MAITWDWVAPWNGAVTGIYAYSDYGIISNTWDDDWDTAFEVAVIVSPPHVLFIEQCRFEIDGTETGTVVETGERGAWSGEVYIVFRYHENPTWPGCAPGVHTYRLKLVTSQGTDYSALVTWTTIIPGDPEEDDPPAQPINPTPADESGPGVDFSDWTFTWEDGGGAASFNLYAGTNPATLNLVTTLAEVSYVVPVANIFRTTLLGGVIYWRVDAINEIDTTIGTVWSFDPRPAKATTPVPADGAIDQRLNLAQLAWTAATEAETYDVYFDTESLVDRVSAAQTGVSFAELGQPFVYDTSYIWRIDSINAFGTTTGDEWTFTTISFDPPIPTWKLVPGHTLGPLTDGVPGVDFVWNGTNNMVTTKRLVVAANNTLWYEDI